MRCVSMCLSVCVSVTFVNSVKANKHIFDFFSPSGSHTNLVFRYQTAWQYSDVNPVTGASNAGGIGRNRDSETISGFTAYCWCCNRPGVVNTAAGGPRPRPAASCDTSLVVSVREKTKCLWQEASTLHQRQQNGAFNCTQWLFCGLHN